jgi:hypothetical protein
MTLATMGTNGVRAPAAWCLGRDNHHTIDVSGGGCRNSVRSGSGEHVSNEFYGLTHHIGEARCSPGPTR